MAVIRITTFAGAMPIIDPRLLPEQAAFSATNLDASGGALKPMTGPNAIKELDPETKTVFKIPFNSTNIAVDPGEMVDATWLEFEDINTDVLRTPNVNDSFDRYYWASPSTGLLYAPRADLVSGGADAGIGVGIEVATTPLEVVATGGTESATSVTRAYVQTFVSIYGEEGQPGPVFSTTGKPDADWTITSIDQPVNAAGTTEIDRIRIYRTITAASGVTTFFRVETLPVGTTTFVDNLSDAVVSANQQIESTLWAPPPEGLQGIIAMPNGIFVGWVASTLYFCENYRPHAWPREYALTVQFPIVGLGVFGSTCVVCTTGNPATVSGIKSNTMALTQSDAALPCLSRRGIVSTVEGVFYPSTDGLVLIGPAGGQIVTAQVIERDQWLTTYDAKNIKAYYSRGTYGAVCSATIAYQFSTIGVIHTRSYTDPVNVGTDRWSSKTWLIDDGQLLEWEPAIGDPLLYRWRSKPFVLPKPVNLGAAQLSFDASTPVGNEEIRLRVWADGRMVYDEAILLDKNPYRLPNGFKADVWEFEVEGKVRVHNCTLASSIRELANV